MKRTKCIIKECNSYICYPHLQLCKGHYAKLLSLGWKKPTRYMDADSAKRVIEKRLYYY